MMKFSPARLLALGAVLAYCVGCESSAHVDVVDLNKVLDALVAVLDEGAPAQGAPPAAEPGDAAPPAEAKLAANDGKAEVTSDAEIQAIAPSKQDPVKEADFLKRYAAKLNEMKVMSVPVGVSLSPGGEIIGFQDPNENLVQEVGEDKEFTVTIDLANNRLVASDNHGYHRPHGYGFRPGGLMMGYMLGSMLGRQNSFYSGPMAASKPSFTNTPMSPANYHSSAVNTARSRISSSSSARARTGSKGFSFGK